MVTSKFLEDQAKQAAVKAGKYAKDESSDVLASVVSKTVTVVGNTKTEVTMIGEVTTEGKSETYSSFLGSGASASKTIGGAVGYEKKVTTDLGGGDSKIVTDKAYGGISGEANAKAVFTDTSKDAEASAKGVAHVELRHTETNKYGNVETTTSTYVAGDAQAGVKAGFHLGYDGAKVGATASAGASISTGTSGEVKIGDAKAVGDIKVFAQAQAEATASAEVTFDPTKGTANAKAELGAMASAGIGAEAKAGLFDAKTGSGVGAGASISVGAAGVKFKPELEIKNGKLDLKIEFGAGLGMGANANVQIKGDLNKAKDNFNAASRVALPPSAVLFNTIVGFFS